MLQHRMIWLGGLLIGMLVSGPRATAHPGLQGYVTHEAMTRQLIELDQSELVTLESLGQSVGGRNIWAVTVGSGTGPAIAVLGNIHGAHALGGELCVRMAQRLVSKSSTDESIRKLLSEHRFYFIPRPDPDTCEKLFAGPWREPAGNDRRTDDDRDFEIGEDPCEDLDGDGWITMMRVADEDGTHLPQPHDARLLIPADPVKNERGRFRLYSEGRDNDGDQKWNEDAGDGVAIDRNFPFRYVPFAAHRGANAASEPETRAIADFLFDHPQIAVVLSFTTEENVLHPWKPNADKERQRIKTTVLGADAPVFDFLSAEYKQRAGIPEGPAGSDAPGTFATWAYYHLGKWSLAMRGWSVPKVPWAADEKPPADGRAGDEINALRWLERESLPGFSPWVAVEHPDFPGKTVEVGGFRSSFLLNPPARELDRLADKHFEFLAAIPPLLPKIVLAETRVEVLGGNVVRITATSSNRGFLPTMPEMGRVNDAAHPLQLSLSAPEGTTFLNGAPRQRVPRLAGNGGRHESTWLVRLSAPLPAKLRLELAAPAAGKAVAEIELKSE